MTGAVQATTEPVRIRLEKSVMKEALAGLMKDRRVAAPVKESSAIVFRTVGSVDEIDFGDEAAYKSPKEFLFPQVEKLMVFKKDGGLESRDEAPKTVLFGVRPCDLEALKIMKAVFTKGRYEDTYFSRKLENTVLIGLGCISEKTGCFCRERGIDRGFSADCDIFLEDDGNYYIADIITEKGRELFEASGIKQETRGIKPEACTLKPEAPDAASAALPAERAKLLELDADENTLFNRIDWAQIAEKCLGCGTCTYICPTCHCFAFKDVGGKEGAERYRCWDSCMNPGFTLHASGHNPRASKKERYRQRILHKYLYVKENFGYTACTGCGRCIRSCPAGMNIKSVVSGITEDLK